MKNNKSIMIEGSVSGYQQFNKGTSTQADGMTKCGSVIFHSCYHA